MELRDLIVTPIILFAVYVLAYLIRPMATDGTNRKYFFPALTVRIIGALAIGFIYQFYYGGGDTFTYHTQGSRIIWEAFLDSPVKGIQLLFSNGEHAGSTFEYSSRIWMFADPSSFAIVKLATIFDLLTFSTYSATAVLFAVIGFVGSWLFFLTFYKLYPDHYGWLAVICLFVPSVFFWGSGILKDTITLSALGMATFFIYRLFFERRFSILNVLALLVTFYVMFAVKKYILLCFLPAVLLWISDNYYKRIKSLMLRILLVPLFLTILVYAGLLITEQIVADDPKYNLKRLPETARITAYDIGFYTGRSAGSPYSLGELDGTYGGMVRLAPAAINVSLFRPYLWEVNNPFMLLASIEAIAMLFLTLYIVWFSRFKLGRLILQREVKFCLVFALVFAFAVGVSTFNFGTLVRYKIPMIPFYLVGISLVYYHVKRERKLSVLERTE